MRVRVSLLCACGPRGVGRVRKRCQRGRTRESRIEGLLERMESTSVTRNG